MEGKALAAVAVTNVQGQSRHAARLPSTNVYGPDIAYNGAQQLQGVRDYTRFEHPLDG